MPFELQGHRGARGLKPENTLPSFEAALDAGVTSIETDVHLTRDRVPVLIHDPFVSERLCGSVLDPTRRPAVSSLTLAELQRYRVDRNPDPVRFPQQTADQTPVARKLAGQLGMDPYAPPALIDLFALAAEYTGEPGKTEAQRARARSVRFDVELKRVPFRNDLPPGFVEDAVVRILRSAGVVERTAVRSFDHRSVLQALEFEPRLTGIVLIEGTAPIDPATLVRAAGACVYAPSFESLDADQVRRLHDAEVRVIPWTVNEPDDLRRLLDWGVDGVTTDLPDRLASVLRECGVAF